VSMPRMPMVKTSKLIIAYSRVNPSEFPVCRLMMLMSRFIYFSPFGGT
jgi:hypothetical protein